MSGLFLRTKAVIVFLQNQTGVDPVRSLVGIFWFAKAARRTYCSKAAVVRPRIMCHNRAIDSDSAVLKCTGVDVEWVPLCRCTSQIERDSRGQ